MLFTHFQPLFYIAKCPNAEGKKRTIMQSAALFLEQTRLLEQISGHQSPKKEETVDIYGGSIKSTYADGILETSADFKCTGVSSGPPAN